MKLLSNFAASCQSGNFLSFPSWHKYLEGVTSVDETTGVEVCTPQLASLSDFWLIVIAIVEMLLRVAGLAAVIFIIYGGVQYILSSGEPDKTNTAKNTIINAIAGLVIAVVATALVSFIGGRF